MNKEELLKRISQIQLSQEQLKSQFSTLQGHLDEAYFWLKKLDEPVAEPAAAQPIEELEQPEGEEPNAAQEGNE